MAVLNLSVLPKARYAQLCPKDLLKKSFIHTIIKAGFTVKRLLTKTIPDRLLRSRNKG